MAGSDRRETTLTELAAEAHRLDREAEAAGFGTIAYLFAMARLEAERELAKIKAAERRAQFVLLKPDER